MKKLLALLLMLAAQSVLARPANPLILISIDGFRADYLQRGVTPNLNALAARGVRAQAMRPSFPSLTFPNHYTLVTGLRPDHHGLVDNQIFDPAIPERRFKLSDKLAVLDRRWWDQGVPVWVTAEQHGLRSAMLFWPGSEADIQGVRPTLAPAFDDTLTPEQRVDLLLSWLDQPQQQWDFLSLYFSHVDHAGHDYGPDADATTAAVAQADQAIGRLLAGLQQRGVDANLVVVADHGMAAVSPERVIRMDLLAPAGSYEKVTDGPYAALNPVPGQSAQLEAALLKPWPHMQCWRKQDIPTRLAYGQHARVPALLCLAEPGWSIVFSAQQAAKVHGGRHGYDNGASEMAALCIAAGPALRSAVQLPVIDNVDVYPLLMQLLALPARSTDGQLTPWRAALR